MKFDLYFILCININPKCVMDLNVKQNYETFRLKKKQKNISWTEGKDFLDMKQMHDPYNKIIISWTYSKTFCSSF